jgi:hypothetical protein
MGTCRERRRKLPKKISQAASTRASDRSAGLNWGIVHPERTPRHGDNDYGRRRGLAVPAGVLRVL